MADYEQYSYITKRVRYFDTQFLKDQDFIDEQKYHLDRQRRPLRHLHVSGIVEGLTVEPGDGKKQDAKFQAVIAPGTAIDQNGRQIVLPETKPPETVALTGYADQIVEVFISYQQLESDMAQEGGKANRRWHERPLVKVVGPKDTIPETGIRLARLSVNSDGLVTIDRSDPNVRQYAGVNLPSSDGNQPTLRSAGDVASNLAVLSGSLSVTGNIGISTQFPKDKLSIQGGALSFSNDNAVPQVGIDYDATTDTLRVRGNRNAQLLNTNLLAINRTTGAVSIGTPSTSGGLEIYRGNTNDVALSLNSSGSGWGSGLQFKNTATNAKTYGIYSGSDGKWHFGDVDKSSDRLVIDQDGNIGIGATNPAARLAVQTPGEYDGGTIRFEARKEPTNYHLNLKALVDSSRVRWVFDQKNAGSDYSSVLTFDQGSVGIGTAEPSAKLEVKLTSATTDTSLKLEHNGSNLIVRPLSAGGTSSVIENTGGGALVINPNGKNVGIGTSDPKAKLAVQTSGEYDGDMIRFEAKKEPASYYLNLKALVDSSRVRWIFDQRNAATDYNSVLTFDRGSVGIGTAEPLARLDIAGSSGTVLRVGVAQDSEANIDLAGHVQLKAYGKGNLAYLQARDDTDNRAIGLRFRTQKAKGNLTEAMTIDSDGNVNIAGSIDVAQKPIELVTYSNIAGEKKTEYSTRDWVCCIAGFATTDGDINENNSGPIIHVYAYQHSDGFWYVTADFRTHNDKHEAWSIVVMAIRKSIAKVR